MVSFYQYSDEPEVRSVIFVQPGSVDLHSMTGEEEEEVIGERHQGRGYQRRQQQPKHKHTLELLWEKNKTVCHVFRKSGTRVGDRGERAHSLFVK